MSLRLQFSCFAVSFIFILSVRAQQCMVGNAPIPLSITFKSELLRRELSGFFPYPSSGGIIPTEATTTKYQKEEWSGSGHWVGHDITYGWTDDITNIVFSGDWRYSISDFTDVSTKSIHGHIVSGNIDGPYDLVNLKSGLDSPGLPQGSSGTITGPVAQLNYQSPTKRSILWSGGLNASSGWVNADLKEELSGPFTVADAIARADLAANIRPQDINTLSEQHWDNYSPATMGEVTSRTQPVLFHAQRVSFRVELPAKPCGGKYKLVLKFKDWAYTEDEPKLPNKTLVSSDLVELDKENVTEWPSATTYKTYEDFGLPLQQGRRARLVSAELYSADSCVKMPLGDGTFDLGSVDFSLPLGRVNADDPAGVISLMAPTVTVDLFTPAALQLTADPSVTVVRDASGALRQVAAPEVFVDIVTLTPTSYAIRSYLPTQVGTLDPITGLRSLTGYPLKSYTFTGDASGGTPNFTITPSDVPARAATYTYDEATATMTMSQPAADRIETIVSTTSGTTTPVTTETRTIQNNAADLVSEEVTTYNTYSFGRVVTARALGVGLDRQLTTTSYYTTASDTSNYGHIKQVTEPSGAWTLYTYDAQSRVLTETHRYLNNSSGSQRVITSTYGTIPDQDGDGLPEELITRVQTTLTVETSRTYEITFTAPETYNGVPTTRTQFIRAATPGAAWNDSSNLVSVSRTIASGPYADKPASFLSPEGILTTYSYATDATSGEITTTTDAGAPNAALATVMSGTRTVTRTDAFGHVTEQTTTDLDTSTILEAYIVTEKDTSGRPRRIDYTDGTYELRSYACCGLDSITTRQRATTNYVYDPLGRLEKTISPDGTTRYEYDAAGNRLKTIRIGSDSSEITLSEATYDTAGRLTSTKDALGRPTTYAYQNISGGGTLTTITTPGGGTRIETTAADGALLKVEGTAAPWRTYAYTVNSTGTLSTIEYLPSADITETTAWHRTTTDFLGRVSSENYPDGATANHLYNSLGQLSSQTDPDGVQILYAYDTQGRLTTTALDLNRNGVIDYAGTDRVSRTTTTYTTHAGIPVSRTTAEIWETDNNATPTTVSVTDTTLDGRETWQTVRGLATHTVTTYSSTGDATTVTDSPDGTTQTSITQSGRPSSVTVSHPSLGTLSSTTYDYDPQGRLWHQITSTGTTITTYFDDDQVETIKTPDPDTTRTGPGYDPQTTTYHYDTAGRVDHLVQSDGTTTYTAYTPAGQVLRTWGSRTYPQAYTYDAQQRPKTLTTWQDYANAAGAAVTTWNYHPQRGWLLNKRYPGGAGPAYTYTLAGRLKTRIWARGIVTTYDYDDAGDLSGTTYSDATPAVSITAYDRVGRLHSVTDAAGILTRSYENGHLDDEVYSGTGVLSGLSLTRSQDSLQRLANLTVSSVPAIVYGYDEASRLSTVTQSGRIATQGYHSTLGYPETVSITNAGAPRLTFIRALDNLGRVASVTTPSVASIAYDYNDANQRIKATNVLDGSYWDYGYDDLGQVTSAVKHEANAVIRPGHSFGYTFDDIGNRKQTILNNLTSIYAPDLKNQYLSRTTPAAVPVLGTASPDTAVKINDQTASQRAGSWFYHELELDSEGAPRYFQFLVSATQTQGDPPTSELVRSETRQAYVPPSPEIFTHDADGNLTQDGRWNYTWDAENRLVQIETRPDMVAAAPGLPRQRVTFTYDGQGRRISKIASVWNAGSSLWIPSSQLTFLYDGWNLVAEYNAAAGNALVRSYTLGLDLSGGVQGAGGVGGLLWATVSSAAYAPAFDGNGNIIAWVDLANGDKTSETDYDAFGNPIQVLGSNPTPFGFSTKYTDAETGLNYYGLRYYNPSSGRWINRDPIEEQGGMNVYCFVQNNAVVGIDPIGLAMPGAGYGSMGWNSGIVTSGPTPPPPGPSIWDQFRPPVGPSDGAFVNNTAWFEANYPAEVRDYKNWAKNAINQAIKLGCPNKPTRVGPFSKQEEPPNQSFITRQYRLGGIMLVVNSATVSWTGSDFGWTAQLRISDGVGFDSNRGGWIEQNVQYPLFGTWLFPPRSIIRAAWSIHDSGSCCSTQPSPGGATP